MIPQQWYAVLQSKRLGSKPVALQRLGERLVLWRDAHGRAVCMPDRCCHRAAQLSRGRLREGCLECPYHGLRYDGDGQVVKIPSYGASRPVPKGLRVVPWPCREARGLVWIWYGRADRELPDLPWDDALDAELGAKKRGVDLEDSFDVSYLRVMENGTDLFHVPFVHRNTIPVGEVLEDFECTSEGVHIHVRGRMTDGKKRGVSATVHVVAPTILVMTMGTKIRFLAIATPIDRDHTWLFARYVQDYVRLPLVGRLFSWLLGVLDYRLLQRFQDAPVWRTQQLADPGDIRGYHLLVGDRGVACYFRIRRQLLAAAGATSDGRDDRESATGDQAHRGESVPPAVAR